MSSDPKEIADLPPSMVPCVGSSNEFRDLLPEWIHTGRTFVYWDRGYLNRGGITWLPNRGEEYFRWHVSAYQMQAVDPLADASRFRQLKVHVRDWNSDGSHIVIAAPSPHYAEFHRLGDWATKVKGELKKHTNRKIIVRHKSSRVPLQRDIAHAHCLVTHGSVAAVEAVVLGCPVIVDPASAAAPVGRTSVADVENLARPDRLAWLRSLACHQWTGREIAEGTMWKELR